MCPPSPSLVPLREPLPTMFDRRVPDVYHVGVLQILVMAGVMTGTVGLVLHRLERRFDRRKSFSAPATHTAYPKPISSAAPALWPTDRTRCPYCVERSEFRLMTRGEHGDWYQCESCGHILMPRNKLFECGCPGCDETGSVRSRWA
jgi:predicted RNA-binding Zn-ribbon protein involved in translation (DUF1610 family)